MSAGTLRAQDLISDMEPYFNVAFSRPLRRTQLEVVELKPSDSHRTPFAIPGTVFVFLSSKQSGNGAEVRKAVIEGGEPAKTMLKRWKGQIEQRKQVALGQAVEMATSAEVFGELEYGGGTLANGLFLPKGLDSVILMFPYNGGGMAEGGFVLAEHYAEGTEAGMEGFVVQTAPTLTPAEAAALRLVPASQFRLNVGMVMDCCTTGAAVASVVADVVLLVIALLEPAFLTNDRLNLADEEIERLGPNASARKLLEMRRTFLSKKINRG